MNVGCFPGAHFSLEHANGPCARNAVSGSDRIRPDDTQGVRFYFLGLPAAMFAQTSSGHHRKVPVQDPSGAMIAEAQVPV